MDPNAEVPRLQRRNVEIFGSNDLVIAGLWQYDTLRWDEVYRYLATFVFTREPWTIFHYDSTKRQHGEPCPSSTAIVQPGHYILLSSAGGPIPIGLQADLPRPSLPIGSNTSRQDDHYRTRGLARDGKCLITGLQTETYSRLKVAHIFPRAHDAEWVRKGYPNKITDTADEAAMGGPTKIDSVQNVITLRSDLYDSWENYEFGVDPNDDYRITSFTNGNQDIHGLHLQLDHIQNPTLRPLDELFIDHFKQGILKNLKGAGEPEWTSQDDDDAFREGSNLLNPKIWDTRQGKERFELALADRLFDHHLLLQQSDPEHAT